MQSCRPRAVPHRRRALSCRRPAHPACHPVCCRGCRSVLDGTASAPSAPLLPPRRRCRLPPLCRAGVKFRKHVRNALPRCCRSYGCAFGRCNAVTLPCASMQPCRACDLVVLSSLNFRQWPWLPAPDAGGSSASPAAHPPGPPARNRDGLRRRGLRPRCPCCGPGTAPEWAPAQEQVQCSFILFINFDV